jgi:hypothetical protein
MNDDPYADPFIREAGSMSQADIHLIACMWVGALVLLALAVYIRRITQTALQRGTIARAVGRRRLIFTNVFGVFVALAAPLLMALAAGVNDIESVLSWELSGAVAMLLAFGFAGALVQQAAHRTDRCAIDDSDDDEYHRRSHSVNPATGYPMINSSIDAGGYAYGCGPHDSSEDRHWDR